jgi:hypothetical protein
LHRRSPLIEILFDRGLVAAVPIEYLKKKLAGLMANAKMPSLVIALQGRGLPNGGEVNVILEIDQGLNSGTVEVRCVGHDGHEKPEFRKATLSVDRCRALSKLVENFLKAPKPAERSLVMDGFPCELLIGHPESRTLKSVECNLSDPRKDVPVLLLARGIYETGSQLKQTTMIIGSCDDKGNIDIRPM